MGNKFKRKNVSFACMLMLISIFVAGTVFWGVQGASAAHGGTTVGECMVDRYNATKPASASSLNCTSNDVQLATYEVVSGPTTCLENEVITVVLTGQFVATSAERWDVGVFIAEDGGTPNDLGGSCYSDYLHPVSADNTDLDLISGDGPFYNGEINEDPADMCGDIAQGQNAWFTTGEFQIVCQDSDGDLIADVTSCTVWANSRSDGTTLKPSCLDEADVTAETTAKCTCEPVNIIGIDFEKQAHIEVVKDLIPADAPGLFNLQIDGADEATGVADGGTTGSVLVGAGTQNFPGADHTVGETAGTDTSLDVYIKLISCVDRGLSTFAGGAPLTLSGAGPLTVPVDPDDDIVCTITNTNLCYDAATRCDDGYFCTDDTCNQTTGECIHTPLDPTQYPQCSGGACVPIDDGNVCTLDECDEATGETTHIPGNAGTLCRASAGACDVPEFCSGSSADCPADVFVAADTVCAEATGVCDEAEVCTGTSADCPADGANLTTECRASAGDCDVAEYCSDASDDCPTDVFVAADTVCAEATGVCDEAEVCTGSSADCPADGANLTTECRASAGDCDVAEYCSDASDDCPTDVFVAADTVCAEATGVCDEAEVCTGSSADCPADGANLTTECRASAGDCDVAEYCSDASDDCPTDVFVAADTVCAEATGVCDEAEVCTGSSADCPADGANLTTECRASAGDCDVAEYCSDASDDCPTDVFVAADTVCAEATGVCDEAEVCTGSSADCPADGANLTTECRASAGDCDVAEYCSNASDDCPTDVFVAADTVCAEATGVCDEAEVCTGSSADCPADGANLTTECRASAGDCDVAEYCSDASDDCPTDVFVAADTVCAEATGVCDEAEVCTGSSADCPADGANLTTECRASAGDCDVAEYCSDASDDCPTDVFVAADTVCAEATGVCDEAEVCTGSSADCPADGANLTTECRASAGDCDVAEYCSDASDDCPTDGFVAADTVCAEATGVCDEAEVCTGSSADCPADGANLTTECRASAGDCDVAEYCSDASDDCPTDGFVDEGTVCNTGSGDLCDPDEVCTGSSAACPADYFEPATTVCNPSSTDDEECDPSEYCPGFADTGCPDDYITPEGTYCGDDTDNACTDPDTCDGDGNCLVNNTACSYVTSSSLCPFDVDPGACGTDDPNFRVLFTPDVQNWVAYKQSGTNPGQYYYNLVYDGSANDTVRIVIPWPFVTQGARPVHVYDAHEEIIDADGCFKPCFNSTDGCGALSAEEIRISMNDWVNGGSNDYGVECDPVLEPDGNGNCWFDVTLPEHPDAANCDADETCSYYVNVHLDWGIKGNNVDANPWDTFADRYDLGSPNYASFNADVDALEDDGSEGVGLRNCRPFTFCHDSTLVECGSAEEDSFDVVQNVNNFKKIAGAFGRAIGSNDDSPAVELDVELFNTRTGKTVKENQTDEDGYFTLVHKHKGKPTKYEVRLYGVCGDSLVQEVELQGNGWVEVNFDTDTCTSTSEYGSGRNKNK